MSLEWIAVLAGLALLPLLLVMVTAFAKVVVVLGILKSALGLQGVPPTPIVLGLGLVLTIVIMAPVGSQMIDAARVVIEARGDEAPPTEGAPPTESAPPLDGDSPDWELMTAVASASVVPLQAFLATHAHDRDRELFAELTATGPEDDRHRLAEDDLRVLVPAFAISELKEAFIIGFLLFLPFLVIDMVVANILLSLGMHMVSPTTVSLPFKLLLFVLVDGFYLLSQGLVGSYQMV